MASDSFCVLPWLHLATHPHGGVTLCCVSEFKDDLNRAKNFAQDGAPRTSGHLTLSKNSISEIINSDSFKATRLQMLAGEKPKACWRCFHEEELGVISKRRAENKKFSSFSKKMATALTADNGEIKPCLRFVELRLGNVCNLRCRSCNPASSHRWIDEHSRLSGELEFVQSYVGLEGFEWIEREEFWNDLMLGSESLEVLYINGGEPTLIDRHWQLLSDLIANGQSAHIRLWYNINLTHLPERAFDLWKQFAGVQIYCSIDDLGPRNDLLRSGSSWAKIMLNLEKLRERKWIDLAVNQTVSWLNAFYLDEFYKFMTEKKITVHFNFVYDPTYLSPCILPEPIKQEIARRCEAVMARWESAYVKAQLFATKSNPQLLQSGMRFNAWLDRSRSERCHDVFPELYRAIENGLGSK
jgi:sulfatase maturation enzyme AslB (radical SAM superfamily)